MPIGAVSHHYAPSVHRKRSEATQNDPRSEVPAASVSGSSPESVLQQVARKGSQGSFQERVLVLIAHGYPPFTLVERECWLIVEEGVEHRLPVASLGEMSGDSLQ